MKIEILLTIYDYDCLYASASKRSVAVAALDRVVHLANYGFPASGDLVVTCDEKQARALLRHAKRHCPDTVAKILNALRLANALHLVNRS